MLAVCGKLVCLAYLSNGHLNISFFIPKNLSLSFFFFLFLFFPSASVKGEGSFCLLLIIPFHFQILFCVYLFVFGVAERMVVL